jgi:hypothetical protein
MFPKTKFKSLEEFKFTNMVNKLNETYKKIIVVAGTNQLNELKKLNNIEVITITEDPDGDKTKMKQAASKGIYENFKKKLPSTIRELDGRRLMNDMRSGLGLEPVKEQIVLVKDMLREQYFRGEIFNEGDLVESDGKQYTIAKRGSNHLLLKEESGEFVSKWIHDVRLVENHTLVTHNKDHKELTHGADFSMKIGKEHHGKINGLQHGDQHEFKCMDGNEWTVAKQGDNLRFTGHKLDTNISSNIAFHVPATHFSGEEDPESPNTKQLRGFSKILLDKQQNEPEKLTPQERTLLRMITKSGGGTTEITEGVIQSNGTDKVESTGPESDNTTAPAKPAGKKKGFLTFYNYNTKDNSDFKVVKAESKQVTADKVKDNESDLDKIEIVDTGVVGHSLVGGDYAGAHHHRRQKVAYAFKEEKEAKAVKKLKSFKDATGNGNQNPAGGSGSNVMGVGTGVGASGGAGCAISETALNPNDPHGDYKAKSKALQDIQMDPHTHKDPELKAELIRSKAALEKAYEPHRVKEETLEQSADRKKQLKRFKDQAKSSMLVQDRPGIGTENNQPNDPFFKQ